MLDINLPTAPVTRLAVGAVRFANGDDREADCATLSFASETPIYSHWFDANEILPMKREAIVNWDFANSGHMSFLWNHDTNQPLGVASNLFFENRKLCARVRFAKNAFAQGKLADLRNGDLGNVSIGYQPIKAVRKPNGDVLVSEFRLVHLTMAPDPADVTVGLGRRNTAETVIRKGHKMPVTEDNHNDEDRFAAMNEGRDLADRRGVLGAWRQRFTAAHVRGKTADEIRSESRDFVLASLPQSRALGSPDDAGSDRRGGSGYRAATIDAPAYNRGDHDYSLTRALAAHVSGDRRKAPFEFDVSDAIGEAEKRNTEGLIVPPMALASRATIATAGVTGFLGTDHRGDLIIDVLRQASALIQAGTTNLPGLSKNVDLPKLLTGTTVEQVDEDTAPTESGPTTGVVTLSPKQFSGSVNLTKKTLLQADPAFDEVLKQDFRNCLATALDYQGINGAGGANRVRGIVNQIGIGAVTPDDEGDLTWQKVLELQKAVADENVTATAGGNFAYLCNTTAMIAMMGTEKAEGTAKFVLEGDDHEKLMLAGRKLVVSNNVVGGSTLIYGRFSDLLIGAFGSPEIIVDPYTESAKGNTRISIHAFFDVAIRYAESFARLPTPIGGGS